MPDTRCSPSRACPFSRAPASLIAHLLEEQTKPIGFVLADSGAVAISYDGDAPAGFVAAQD